MNSRNDQNQMTAGRRAEILGVLAERATGVERLTVLQLWPGPAIDEVIARMDPSGTAAAGDVVRALVKEAQEVRERLNGNQGGTRGQGSTRSGGEPIPPVSPRPVAGGREAAAGPRGSANQDIQIKKTTKDPQEIKDIQRTTSTASLSTTHRDPTRPAVPASLDEWKAHLTKLLTIPFRDFVAKAYEFNRWSRTALRGFTPLFWFTWAVRSHPEMKTYLEDPAAALTKVEGVLKGFLVDRRPPAPPLLDPGCKCPWGALFGVTKFDGRTEFMDVWEEARFTLAEDPFPNVAHLAEAYPVKPQGGFKRTRCVEEGSKSDYSFFVSFAAHLQRSCGDRNIMLPCMKLAELMGVDPSTISRYRDHAKKDGFLKEVKQYKHRPGGAGEATEFRFDLRTVTFPASSEGGSGPLILYDSDGKPIATTATDAQGQGNER